MISTIFSAAILGIDAVRITIEVSVGRGVGYYITGLPDDAIKESITRIAIAIDASGYAMPRTKIVVNLFPAGFKKSGTAFDLPIALAILEASGQLEPINKLHNHIVIGEMSLDARVQPITGAIIIADFAKNNDCNGLILPAANAPAAAQIRNLPVYPVNHLKEAVTLFETEAQLKPYNSQRGPNQTNSSSHLDFKDVKGQESMKRALEIAAAGGHNLIMTGPPGSSKTMLASRLPTILPPLTIDECIECTKIHSLSNDRAYKGHLITERPFRTPHHTISDIGLAGGGIQIHPGEISLAHNGILFLDEMPEFKKSAIEILRQPLEERKIMINRSKQSIELPAAFMLIAAMNPCPCGYFGTHPNRCTCSPKMITTYRNKISATIMERIDLQVLSTLPPQDDLMNTSSAPEPSAAIRHRVTNARNIQLKRFENYREIRTNADMFPLLIEQFCELETYATRFLTRTMERHQLSARSFHRILKIARTIADLAGHQQIEIGDVAEAVFYRSLDQPLSHQSVSPGWKADKPNRSKQNI